MSALSAGRTGDGGAGVAVYGATGYTGRLIAAELVEMGIATTLAGRSRDSLERLATELGGDPEVAVVGLDDRDGLKCLCRRVRTVVNAAGPFSLTCEPVARAAIAAGAHYVDVSGEQRSIAFVLEDLTEEARAAGAALLPAAAFYAALSDLLIGIAARAFGPIDEIDLAYRVTDWTPSGAAFLNRLEGIGRPVLQYDRGLVAIDRHPPTRTFDFGPAVGRHRVSIYPAPEVLTLPRHLDAARIRTSMATSTLVPGPLGRLTPQLARATAAGLRRPRAAKLAERLLASASGGSRRRIPSDPTHFDLVAYLNGPAGPRRASLSGRGIFDVTGPIAARIAARTLEDDFDLAGPLSATEAIPDRAAFLDGLAEHGVRYAI